jgi:outer membrane protein TolC
VKKKLLTDLFFCMVLALAMATALPAFAQGTDIAEDADASAVAGDDSIPMRHLSIDEAVTLAIQNNLSLEASRVDVGTKKRAAKLWWNELVPTVGVNATMSAANTATTVSGFKIIDTPPGIVPYEIEMSPWSVSGAFSIQLAKPVFAIVEGMKTLRADYQSGLVSYEKAKVQLEQSVRKLYLNILLMQESLKVQEQGLTLASERVRMAELNYSAGLAPELTLLQARVTRDTMMPTIEQAEDNIKISMANMAMQLGLPYDTVFELDGVDFTAFELGFDFSELISRAAASNMDVMELQANIRTLHQTKKATQFSMFTPVLSIGWNTAPTLANAFGKTSDWGADNWSDRGAFSLSLSWSINSLLPFTPDGNNIKNLADNERTLNINLAQLIRGTEVNIYNTVFTLQQARESAKAQQLTVNLAQRSFDLTRQAFNAGLQDLIEVNNAQNQLNQAKLGVLQQQFNYLSGLIDLEYYVGVPFGTLNKK